MVVPAADPAVPEVQAGLGDQVAQAGQVVAAAINRQSKDLKVEKSHLTMIRVTMMITLTRRLHLRRQVGLVLCHRVMQSNRL